MHERERIAHLFAPLARGEVGSFGLKDDAAAITPPPRHALVITTDSVIQGTHVFANATPQQYAQKLVRRNMSDLAAMGAKPWRCTLNMHTTPSQDDAWFAAFASTLAAEQEHFGMVLVGGDSTSGGALVHLSMTCFGLADGNLLRRSGAKPGDDLYVSGTVGDAAIGLAMLQQNPAAQSPLVDRYHVPQPRLALGHALRNLATAAMDISDGLLADTRQLCEASQGGVTLVRDAIPLAEETRTWLAHDAGWWPIILGGGDDYELLFTAHPSQRQVVAEIARKAGVACTRIGSITPNRHITLLDASGTEIPLPKGGWEHA